MQIIDPALFDSDSMVNAPVIVDCSLSTGASAQCARFIVKYKPDSLEIGPFCPETLDDVGGIWSWDSEGEGLYRLDRAFFDMLSRQGFDFSEDGENINIADPAAGRPVVDHACLEASENKTVEMTVLIPTSPQMADSSIDLGTVAKVGLALDGVPIFADAPSVLQTGHLPALDTCGGHIDPGGWYHWHATATDIDVVFEHDHVNAECALPQSSSALFGYAFDGYSMYGSTDNDGSIPDNLDACNGHVGVTDQSLEGEYHYHATPQFPNLPACLSGVQAKDNFSTTASLGIGSAAGSRTGGGPAGHGVADLTQAADVLKVSKRDLIQAIQGAGGIGPQLDIGEAASTLGVTPDALIMALPKPPGK